MGRGTRENAPLERMIHLGVVQILLLNAAPGLVWTHVANERRTTPREGAFLKRMGVRPGWADFTLLIPPSLTWDGPHTAFLEIKRPGGRLSVAQEQFRDDVTAIGCLWALAYSTDQAAGFLKEWGALRSAPMTKRTQALRDIKKLGIEPGDKRYPDAVSALTRGWPVWKVAQAYKLDPHLIHRLGGPKPVEAIT